MKTALLTTALVVAALPAQADNKNFGKSDDYGSERFSVLNQCFIENAHQGSQKLPDCMKDKGYAFLPEARVFGNSGPKCKKDEMGPLHSWCWGKTE
jgi:hypothetical protein